jgi:hypothetical protein
MVNLFDESARMKKILNRHTYIPSYNMPGLFVEKGGAAIRTWGFVISNAEDCLSDILMRNRGEEKAMKTSWQTWITVNNCTIKWKDGLG